jgi:Cu(I)/Ag(I) efflux system membrane fusion protein
MVLIAVSLLIGYRMGSTPSSDLPITADHEHANQNEPTRVQEYTCSMHPTVRLSDPDARCPICFMALVPVSDHGQSTSPTRLTLSPSAAQSSRIETIVVSRFFPRATVRLYGKVTYDETSLARLSAYFAGRIERLFVNYVGVPVAEGEHIADIYSPDLLAAFGELRQAARSDSDSASMSDLVRASTHDTLDAAREKLRLFGLSPEQIASVEAGEYSSDSLTIHAPIGGVVTHLAVRDGDYVEEGSPIATVADLSRLWLDLEAYESQLPLLRWGQRVEFTVESQPGLVFAGHISFIEPMIDERTRTASVRVAVNNEDRLLKPGMFASALVSPRVGADGAVPGDELRDKWVGPMHPTIVRDEPGQCDICGMELVPTESLHVAASSARVDEPVVVPTTAVLFTGARSVVYVEVPHTQSPTYEGREVVLGARAGDQYVIRDGLEEGERVVVNGAFRIDSEMQIQARPSMMSPHGDDTGAHSGHDTHASAESKHGALSEPDMEFVGSLSPLYSTYFNAQEALANDSLEEFNKAAASLMQSVSQISLESLDQNAAERWRAVSGQIGPLETYSSIEDARSTFEQLSQGIISIQRQFGHVANQTWHVAYCPMAFNNTGAQWLQRSDVINNPYFGASMLRCGEITQDLRPLPGETSPSQNHGDGDG